MKEESGSRAGSGVGSGSIQIINQSGSGRPKNLRIGTLVHWLFIYVKGMYSERRGPRIDLLPSDLDTFFRFGCLMPLFLYFFFIFLLQHIHSYSHSLITFAEALLHMFIAASSEGGTSLGCRADIRTRACLTASQRTTI